MEKKPEISKVSVEFIQDGNTLGTTEEVESLTVNLEFQLDESDGSFIVLKTDGWSIDDLDDLGTLINRV